MKYCGHTLVDQLWSLLALLPARRTPTTHRHPRKIPIWQRGRAVFVANCVACHNNDPSKDGPIGPAIKGSSRELIEARVLSTSYPPNYKPKRPTKVMPQFPFLKDEIPYLAAYLESEMYL